MFEMMTGNCCLLVYLIFFTAFTYEQQSTMDSTTMTTATDVKLLDEDGKTDPGGATYSVGEENSSPETTINENQSTTSDSDAAKTEDSQDTMIDAGTKTSTSKEDETSTPKLVTTVNELGDSDNQGSTTTSRPTDAKSTQTISEDEMSTSKLMTTLADDDRTTLTTSSQAEMEMMSKPVNSVEMSSTTVSMIPSVSTPLIESTPRILNVEIPPIQPESVFPFIPAPPSEDSAASLEQKPTDDRYDFYCLISPKRQF